MERKMGKGLSSYYNTYFLIQKTLHYPNIQICKNSIKNFCCKQPLVIPNLF